MMTKERVEMIKQRIKDLKWSIEYHKEKTAEATLDLEVWQKQLDKG